MGIDALSRYRTANKRAKNRARLAALLALVPGLGAVYNHQNVKAIFHFIGVILLFQLTEIKSLDVLFALAGTVAYFYTIIDAYRTSERIANGEDPQVDEARFKRNLASRAAGIGVLLLLGGALLLIQLLHPFGADVSLMKLLPVMLILCGGYLIVGYIKKSREREEEPPVYTPGAPYPLTSVKPERERIRQYAAGSYRDRGDDVR
jgi:hypothetical protein